MPPTGFKKSKPKRKAPVVLCDPYATLLFRGFRPCANPHADASKPNPYSPW